MSSTVWRMPIKVKLIDAQDICTAAASPEPESHSPNPPVPDPSSPDAPSTLAMSAEASNATAACESTSSSKVICSTTWSPVEASNATRFTPCSCAYSTSLRSARLASSALLERRLYDGAMWGASITSKMVMAPCLESSGACSFPELGSESSDQLSPEPELVSHKPEFEACPSPDPTLPDKPSPKLASPDPEPAPETPRVKNLAFPCRKVVAADALLSIGETAASTASGASEAVSVIRSSTISSASEPTSTVTSRGLMPASWANAAAMAATVMLP